MATQHVIGGVTFPSALAVALPAIAALKVLAFFGSAGDGINTNRAPGGAAFTAVGSAPVVSTNYLSFGVGGVAMAYGLPDLVKSSAVLNSGWTFMAVARVQAAGGPGVLLGDNGSGNNNSATLLNNNSSGSSVYSSRVPGLVSDGMTLGPSGTAAAFRCYGRAYSGGGTGGTFFLSDLTGAVSLTCSAASGVAATATVPHIGYDGIGGNGWAGSSFNDSVDVAFAMVALTYLNFAAQQAIYNSVKTLMLRRGITV